jgi:hypothetical protein
VRLAIDNIDGPRHLADKAPVIVDLVRQIPGPDRPDYWIAALETPLSMPAEHHDREVTHLILAARWVGTAIASGIKHIPVGIAYVIESSLLTDEQLSFAKCRYVAIATASDISTGNPPPKLTEVLAGRIAAAFGLGKKETQ